MNIKYAFLVLSCGLYVEGYAMLHCNINLQKDEVAEEGGGLGGGLNEIEREREFDVSASSL